MQRSAWIVWVGLLSLIAMAGCGRSGSSVRLSDVVPMTVDTLSTLLVGERDVPATRTSPVDKPLLQHGVYESVAVAADAQGFADISRGALKKDDVLKMQHDVVDKLNQYLKRTGYSAAETSFPPAVTADRTLLATLTPQPQEGGSDEDRANGKGKTLVLIRVTVTDAKTGSVLAQRDYYSGSDARQPGEVASGRHSPDFP